MFCLVVSYFVNIVLSIFRSSESSENLDLLSGLFSLKRKDFCSSEKILAQPKIVLKLELLSGSFLL